MAKFRALTNLLQTLKDWEIGLKNLSVENVKGYEWEGEILPTEEVQITHTLKLIPTRFIITEANGTNSIVKGEQPATTDHFYLKNIGLGETFTGRVLIMP